MQMYRRSYNAKRSYKPVVNPNYVRHDDITRLAVVFEKVPERYKSVAQEFIIKGSAYPLTEKQMAYVRDIIAMASPVPATTTPAAEFSGFGSIVAFMHAAKKNIQYPKARFTTKEGDRLMLSVAGVASKNPGAINVNSTDPIDKLKVQDWFGKIMPDGIFIPNTRTANRTQNVVVGLRRFAENPTQFAATYGQSTHNCVFCTKGLTT